MWRNFAASVLLLTSLAGCSRKDDFPAWPNFAMTIPADVPELMVVSDKDGNQHQINGREAYTTGYRGGWKRCVRDYEKGLLDLAVEKPEVPLVQEYGIVIRGWESGFLTCWRAIRKARQ